MKIENFSLAQTLVRELNILQGQAETARTGGVIVMINGVYADKNMVEAIREPLAAAIEKQAKQVEAELNTLGLEL